MVSLHMRPVNERELIWIVMSLCFMACFTVKLFCKVSSRIFFCLGGVADGREGGEGGREGVEGGREGVEGGREGVEGGRERREGGREGVAGLLWIFWLEV